MKTNKQKVKFGQAISLFKQNILQNYEMILINSNQPYFNYKFKYNCSVKFMSFYRQSPPKRDVYSRSPAKILQSQRDFIEEQIKLKNAYRSQAENRRLLDEISLLQIKTRKIDQLQARCEALIKQNSLLTSENDQFAKQLSERRYEVERIRSSSIQLQERDNIKSSQLGQINRSLEIEIQLLKKERIQSTKLYENHIQKLEIMLQDKIKDNQVLGVKCNDLINLKEISEIKFEQEKNKLKNLMSRTSYDMERELEYTKQKQSTEKFVEIQTLKKNYSSQIALLQDEISKLKATNSYKNTEFEGQLQENRNLKNRYEQEVKSLLTDNDLLRERILKLEEMNKTEVQNIQQKYNNLHTKGTTSLKEEHQRQIRLLLEQIDREKWIIAQKNNEIQHLIREKRDQQSSFRDRQLFLVTESQTLKNKLNVQQTESAAKIHELLNKINDLHNKNLRDNENYFERVKNFQNKIKDLEREIDTKQAEYQNLESTSNLKILELKTDLQEVLASLRKTIDALNQSQYKHRKDNEEYNQYRKNSESQRAKLSKRIAALEVELDNQRQAHQALRGDSSNNEELLNIEIKSLKQTISVLEKKLKTQQESHWKEMQSLSQNLKEKIEKLQNTNNKLIQQLRNSHGNEVDVLRRRIQKLEREKDQMQSKLKEYIKLYQGLEKYFSQPSKQAVFRQKASSSIFQVLQKTSTTSIHIF